MTSMDNFWQKASLNEIRLLLGDRAIQALQRWSANDSKVAGYVESVKKLGLTKTRRLEAGILGHYDHVDDDGSRWEDILHLQAGRDLIAEMDAYLVSVNTEHKLGYEEAPHMFRGTSVEEALDVVMTGTSGGRGKYPFKALSWDVGSALHYFKNALLVYNGDSIRNTVDTTLVEYTYRHVHFNADERIETPMTIYHVPEREVRVPVSSADPKLEAIIVSEDRINEGMIRLAELTTRAKNIRLVRL